MNYLQQVNAMISPYEQVKELDQAGLDYRMSIPNTIYPHSDQRRHSVIIHEYGPDNLLISEIGRERQFWIKWSQCFPCEITRANGMRLPKYDPQNGYQKGNKNE